MYKRKYINPEIDLSESIVKRSDGGDLTEAKDFVNDWNSKRDPQLKENLQTTSHLPLSEKAYKKHLKSNTDSVEKVDITFPEEILGAYSTILHKIALNDTSKSTKVHEVSHASKPWAQKGKIRQLKKIQKFLREGVTPDEYLDSDSEIYSRLMSLREELKLDPKKHYKPSEIRKIINEHSETTYGIPGSNGYRILTLDGKGNVKRDMGPKEGLDYNKAESHSVVTDKFNILDRYTPLFVESLINEVADNRKYIPRASSGMALNIVDWYRNLLGKDNSRYKQFEYEVSAPSLSMPAPTPAESSTEDTSTPESEPEVELAYANAHKTGTTPVAASQGTTPTAGEVVTAEKKVEAPSAKHVYTNGVDYNGFSEKIKGFLDRVAKAGIALRITSGKRAPGEKFSHHTAGNAVDFTPVEGQTWDNIADAMLANTDLMDYVRQNGINLYDERQNTGAKDWTGSHWHVGLDTTQAGGWDKLQASRAVKAQRGTKFIQPNALGQWTSYHEYTTPELPKSVSRHFGKNSDNVREIIVELKKAGWNDRQISAYVGNVAAESTGNPHVINSIGAQGLIQRLYDRKEPIRSIPSLDLPVQLGYDIDVMAGNVSRQEMSNEWPRRKQRNRFLNGTGSVKSLTDNLMKNYVRPSKDEQKQTQDKRRQVAYDVYNFLNNK